MAMMLLAALALQPAEGGLDGRWANPDASVIIEIAPCGAARCGTVKWASEKAKADARSGGTAQLVGTELLSGLKQAGDGSWHGKIFVPDHGIRAKAKLVLTGANRLRVSGCAFVMFCKTQGWTRTNPPSD